MEHLAYYDDAYLSTLETEITEITPVDGFSCLLKFASTIFYPEGGGQPGDRGKLEVPGKGIVCLVTDTQKEHSNIASHKSLDTKDSERGLGIVPVHRVSAPASSFETGDKVRLILDWEHRYFFMRLHTAQHLLSGLMYTNYGLHTVSVHLGREALTIEFEEGEIEDSVLYDAAALASKKAAEDRKVTTAFLTHKQAEELGMRRSIKVDTDVRVVTIEGTDTIACGGIHTASTSECGNIFYLGKEMIRGHVRAFFAAGEAAYLQSGSAIKVTGELCALLSAKKEELPEIVKKNLETVSALKAENAALKEQLAVSALNGEIVCLQTQDELDPFAKAAQDKTDLALFALKSVGGRTLWMFVLKGKYENIDFNALKEGILGKFAPKGGGRSPLYRGSCAEMDNSEISEAFESFKNLVG